jgi:hypothetical protein
MEDDPQSRRQDAIKRARRRAQGKRSGPLPELCVSPLIRHMAASAEEFFVPQRRVSFSLGWHQWGLGVSGEHTRSLRVMVGPAAMTVRRKT